MKGTRTLPSPARLQRCQGLGSLTSPLQGDRPLAKSVPGLGLPTPPPCYMEDATHRIPPPQEGPGA